MNILQFVKNLVNRWLWRSSAILVMGSRSPCRVQPQRETDIINMCSLLLLIMRKVAEILQAVISGDGADMRNLSTNNGRLVMITLAIRHRNSKDSTAFFVQMLQHLRS